MALMVGGAAVLVVVLFLVISSRDDNAAAAGKPRDDAPTAPASSKTPPPRVTLGSPSAGKTPTTKAPPLTVETLQELQRMLDEAKKLLNEGKTARTGRGDNQAARAKMAEVTRLLEQWEQLVAKPLRWQEDAQMEDWAQPAEYVTLEKMYGWFAKYQKEARMGGG